MNERKKFSNFIVILLFIAVGTAVFNIYNVWAQTASVTATVRIAVCGNSIVDSGEECDGSALGGETCETQGYASGTLSCTSACTFDTSGCVAAAVCGNNVKETGEECDGSDLAGETCETQGYASGTLSCASDCTFDTSSCVSAPTGGGGGVAAPPPAKTKVVIKGLAYPEAEITVLVDGKVVTTERAGSLANFRIEITDITAGVWTFSLWAVDKEGRKSITVSFTANVAKDVTTTISGIFIPPTIELSKTRLQKGDILSIYGQTAPESKLSISVESPEEIVKRTIASEEGDWEYPFDTSPLDDGFHTTRAKATSPGGLLSSYSKVLGFYIGKWIPGLICPNADLNGDGRVNLVDFSILLYWWGRANACADQNKDGIVNLPDFSIMMYYWTG